MSIKKFKPPYSGENIGGNQKTNTLNIKRIFEDVNYMPEIRGFYEKHQPFLIAGWCPKVTLKKEFFEFFVTRSGFTPNNYEFLSIDKITLLFDCHSLNHTSSFLTDYWKKFDNLILLGNPEDYGENKLYRFSCMWFNEFRIEWGQKHGNSNSIRLEFNPNKCDMEKLIYFFAIIKKTALDSCRITRIDVAIDYGIYINPLLWSAKGVRIKSCISVNDIVRTVYLGSKKSDNTIKIYDKAFELREEQGVNITQDLWRVEGVMKDFKTKYCFLRDTDILERVNIFEKLDFYDCYSFEPHRDDFYNLFVSNVRAYGISYTNGLVDRRLKFECLKKIKEDMSELGFNLPSVIYKNTFKYVYENFLNKINILFEKGQNINLYEVIGGGNES